MAVILFIYHDSVVFKERNIDMIWIVNVSNNYLYQFIVTAWLLKNES